MFDKFKEINKLRQLKNEAEAEVFEVEKKGVRVCMDGALSVKEIILNPELADDSRQGDILKDCLNEAIKKAQMSMAKKFSGMV